MIEMTRGESAKSFGDGLRRARTTMGWTQEQLSQRCGISRREIGRYERGERDPGLYAIRRLAHALNKMKAGNLIDWKPPKK